MAHRVLSQCRRDDIESNDVITAPLGPFQSGRTALVSLAVGVGSCILPAGWARADLAPWLNPVRSTEMFVLATSADDPALRGRLTVLSPAVRPDEAQRVAE